MNPAFLAVDNLIASYNQTVDEISGTDEAQFGTEEFAVLIRQFQEMRRTIQDIKSIITNEGF